MKMSVTVEETILEPEPEEVWVQVPQRKGRRTRTGPIKRAPETSQTPVPSTPTITLEQMKQDHDRYAKWWKSSPSHDRLQELLSKRTDTVGKVTNAVCFGVGTFDPPGGSWDQKRRAHVQLTAFLAIVEHLEGKEPERNITCFFQEPIFNSVDKAFIESLGHEVVESPKGFQLVHSSSLAFGVHLYRDVYSEVIAAHIPALFVGTGYDDWHK